jgi:starch synthase (maltosyl-transferring)
VQVPLDRLGIPPDHLYVAHDLLDDVRYQWRGEWNYVRFDPGVRQGHLFEFEV